MLSTAHFDVAISKVGSLETFEKRNLSLFETYQKHFATIPADSDDKRELFYRLRYQVYCIENHFEDSQRCPEGLETDEFDCRSVSSLLVHVPTGVAAGGIRIILPSQDCGPRDLPIWRVCDRKAHAEREKYVPLNRTVEVSRIAVSKEFRQRCGRKWEGEAGTTSRMVTTQLSMGLLGAVIRMCAECNMTHLTAIMEASMLRLFANFGVHLHKLGAAVEYHGLRHPVYADIDALLAQAWVERPDVWAILTDHGECWPLNRRLAQFYAGKPAVNAGCA